MAQLVIRPLALSLAAGTALLAATLSSAAESFPVVHNEPITVRILGGKNGQPVAHSHLILLAGYDANDLYDQLYRAEVLTDAIGQARLPKQLANLPWLQIWVNKKPLCQAKPRGASFSVELIRRYGLSAPNLCGTATVEDAPGVFTVFVKSKGNSALGKLFRGRAKAQSQASAAPVITPPAVEAPAPKPASPPAAPSPAAVVVVALPAPAPTPAPVVVAQPASPPAGTPAPALATVAAKAPAGSTAKAVAHRPVRPVTGRPMTHRPRPYLAACPVQPLAAEAAQARAFATRNVLPVKAINAAHKPKPPAGVRMGAASATHKPKPMTGVTRNTATPDKPQAPPKQE